MAAPEIPALLDELTPEWLTATLRERALLRDARVTAVSRERLGEGAGFVGQIARLSLSFDRDEPGAPRSLIAKLPTTVPENRLAGELLGLYEREILFYEHLARDVTLRTPQLYGAAMDPNPAAEQGPALVAFIDRRARWLQRALLGLTRWIVGRSTRRYVLLLEDLAPARIGDHVAGCDAETCRRTLLALARAQASLWRSPQLEGRYWVGRMDLGANLAHLTYQEQVPVFRERFDALLPAWAHGTLDWLDRRGADLLRVLHGEAAETIIHGDFRLDNLFFDDASGGAPIAVDWQGVSRGPASYDVAYFLSGSLDVAVPTSVERELVADWHAALVAAGVENYDLETAVREYERSLLAILHRMATIDSLDLGEQRGATLLDIWIARLLRRVQDVDLDAALPAAP